MKKLSLFLLSLLTVFGLVACGGKDEKEPTKEQTEDKTTEQESHPEPVVTNHTVLLGAFDEWKPSEEYEMIEITEDDFAKIDPKSAKALKDAETPIKSIHMFPNHQVTSTAGWKFTANGVEYDGGHALKTGTATKTYKWDDMEEKMTTSWAVTQWIPDPKTAHVESLTPETYFVPNWVEKAPEGKENLGTWADNPAVIAEDGEYNVVMVTYDRVSTADEAGYGIGVYVPSKDTVRLTGERNHWGDSEAVMTQITLDELKALNAELGAKVAADANKPAEIYKYEGQVFQNVQKPGFMAKYYDGTKVVDINPGYTVKVIDVNESVKYDDMEEAVVAVKSTTAWMPDPHKYHMANLTPDTLFIPNWVEKAPEGQEHLGVWADNPVVTAGSGEYTVVFVKYGVASSAEQASGGLAVIKTKELEEVEVLTPEKEALKAAQALGDKMDGKYPANTEKEYTINGKVVAYNAEKPEGRDSYTINMIVEVNGIKFSVWSAQVEEDGKFTYPKKDESLAKLGVGTQVKVTGKLQNSQKTLTEIKGDANFYKGHIEWVREDTYGVVGSINNWGNDGVKDTVMTKGEDGKYTATVELKAGDEIKVRMNNSWDKNWGVDGDKNYKATEAGKYVVTLDVATNTLTIEKAA